MLEITAIRSLSLLPSGGYEIRAEGMRVATEGSVSEGDRAFIYAAIWQGSKPKVAEVVWQKQHPKSSGWVICEVVLHANTPVR